MRFRCWCPNLGDLKVGRKVIEAHNAKDAAERFMEGWFSPAEDRFQLYDVIVRDADDEDAPTEFYEIEPEASVLFVTWHADLEPRRGP
jgi:hypothetical protein